MLRIDIRENVNYITQFDTEGVSYKINKDHDKQYM
jgi:hypothetical protein